ncbi:MAG: DUF444 family protein [Spirochaetota bacterium]|nr:DUF444 family protein [Spirochaetota bacterium]
MPYLYQYETGISKEGRGEGDRRRHREKVREAIKGNIADIISDQPIVGQRKDKIIKIPIKGIKEYQFIRGDNQEGVGQGDGTENEGDILKKGDPKHPGRQPGAGAGEEEGIDYYETDVTLEELINIMFEDLGLPNLEEKKIREIESSSKFKYNGIRHQGIRPRLDKKRTLKEKVKRKVASKKSGSTTNHNDEEGFSFREQDLRYHHVDEQKTYESNAVVICIMDTSGSMDETKKYLARSFYFLLYNFVRLEYRNVEIVFISHHTAAQEVDENSFFHKGESGGTFISSGYYKALEIIEKRYNPELWNIYAFHCSDGDNWGNDNTKAINSARELLDKCNLLGYVEIKPFLPYFPVYSTIKKIYEEELSRYKNFCIVDIPNKESLWPSFKRFFQKSA